MSITEKDDDKVILSGEEFRKKIGTFNKITNPEKGTYEIKFNDLENLKSSHKRIREKYYLIKNNYES